MRISRFNTVFLVATSIGVVMASAASAKGPGGNHGNRSSGNMKMSFNGGSNFNSINRSSSIKSSGLKLSIGNNKPISSNKSLGLKSPLVNHNSIYSKNNGLKLSIGNSGKFNNLTKLNDSKFKKNDVVFKKNDFDFTKKNFDFKKKDFFVKKFDFDCHDKHCYPKSNWWWWNHCYTSYCYPTYCNWSYCYPLYTYPTYDVLYRPVVASGTLASNITVMPPVEASRMKVAVGSVLRLDGQAFGEKLGIARLRLSGMSMPIEVLEWTTAAVQIRLPLIELNSNVAADVEVLRADGTLASKTPIELSAAGVPLALGQ